MTWQRKPEETYCNFSNFESAVDSKTDLNQNVVQIKIAITGQLAIAI